MAIRDSGMGVREFVDRAKRNGGEAHADEIVDVAARVVRVEHRLITPAAQDVAATRAQYERFVDDINHHTMVGEDFRTFMGSFPREAQPMSVLASAINALAAFNPETTDINDPEQLDAAATIIMAKARTIVSYILVAQDRMLAVDVGDLRLALRGRQESGIERNPFVVAQRGHDDAVGSRNRDHRSRPDRAHAARR